VEAVPCFVLVGELVGRTVLASGRAIGATMAFVDSKTGIVVCVFCVVFVLSSCVCVCPAVVVVTPSFYQSYTTTARTTTARSRAGVVFGLTRHSLCASSRCR
jgi:hypothetical protein